MLWIIIALETAAPFIIFGLLVLGLVSISAKSLLVALRPSTRKVKISQLTRIFAAVSVISLAAGLLLILHFCLVGGPNKGLGRQLISSPTNRYYELELGMITVLFAGLLSFIVRGIMRTYPWQKLAIVVVISVAILSVGLLEYNSHESKITSADRIASATQNAILAKLPPIYLPTHYSLYPSTPPVLSLIPGIDSAYSIDLTTEIGMTIAGYHASDVSSYFNPAEGKCDIAALADNKPSPSDITKCSALMNVRGGELYTLPAPDGQPYHEAGAWLVHGNVYYISYGSIPSDVSGMISILKQVSPQEVQKDLTVTQ